MRFFFIFFLMAVIFTVLAYGEESVLQDISTALAITFWIIGATCLITWAMAYPWSLSSYGELLAYKDVLPKYQEAVEKTTEAVVKLGGKEPALDAKALSTLVELGVSVENLSQSTNILSKRIMEQRDYIKDYQETLSRYRVWSSRWFTRAFIARLPKEL